MARTRRIRPGFYRNEELGALHPLARLAAVFMPCEADREGRLDYRPRRLRVTLLPYDQVTDDQFEGFMADLERAGYIRRYEHPDHPYPIIQIVKFDQHQSPVANETPSCIPEELPAKKARTSGSARTTKDRPTDALNLDLDLGSGSGPAGRPPRPAARLDHWMHDRWLEAGHRGRWSPKEWTAANRGIGLCEGPEQVRASWEAYLTEGSEFYAGHEPSKWASNPGRWPRTSQGLVQRARGSTWRPPENRGTG